jgi:hypothetical protein
MTRLVGLAPASRVMLDGGNLGERAGPMRPLRPRLYESDLGNVLAF